MDFVFAFLVCGALAVITQLIAMLTKFNPGQILLIVLTIAGVLTLTGTIMPLAAAGGWGFKCTIIGAGTAIVKYTQLCLGGVFAPFAIFLGLVGVLAVVGVVGGEVYYRRNKKEN